MQIRLCWYECIMTNWLRAGLNFCYLFSIIGVWPSSRERNVIYLGACLIAAVRLAREEEIKLVPRVICKIDDSIRLAEMVWNHLMRR
jgi:hypothetical protein